MRPVRTLRRRTLWVGFVGVLVPLAVLLGLQHRWLVKLDQTSAVAHQATLDNYVEGVSSDLEYHYRTGAERALNLPSSLFTHGRLEKAAHSFKKKGFEGARRLFVVDFSDPEKMYIHYYQPECASLVMPEWDEEVRAVYVAATPWRFMAHKGMPVESVELVADERDPRHRLILNPITDDASRLVGLAGMVLDDEHFQRHALPVAMAKALPDFSSVTGEEEPIVAVSGDRGLLWSNEPITPGLDWDAEKRLSFVFTDLTLGLKSRHATPAQWARRNFLINTALSALLAAALLSGLALALRTASREMKLSQMKSDFVSNVSHELRTPLASVRVFGEFLRLGRFDSADKVREYGDYIESESRRLTQLINNILDFASIESGRKSYRFERADLEELVAETLKTFEVRLRQSGFTITFERPATSLPPVLLDAGAVGQSLANLLDNAVKYSNGSRAIEVALRREGDRAVISVTDHGIGIPKDEQGKIFDRFHRVSTGLVHDVKGSGLGLAIVRHIVEAHRGEVAVESRPGEGSTFSLRLPLERPEAAAEPAGSRLLEPSRRASGA